MTSGRGGADDRPGSSSRGRKAAAFLLIVILALLAYMAWSGLEWYRLQPKRVTLDTPPTASWREYELSGDQHQWIDRVGYPDSFQMMFFQEDVNGSLQTFRLESWDYFNDSVRLAFLNGSLISEERVEFDVGTVVENPYRPEGFTAFMSLDQVLVATGIEDYIVAPTERELVDNAETYFADRLVFGLVDGELVYVETIIPELE